MLSAADLAAEEAGYTKDLDVVGYRGKWRAAKEYAVLHCDLSPHVDGIMYWLKAREIFLALGGEYLDGTRC